MPRHPTQRRTGGQQRLPASPRVAAYSASGATRVAVDTLVGSAVLHARLVGRLDLAVDAPVALCSGRSARLCEHA